jgi:hypothetical protein
MRSRLQEWRWRSVATAATFRLSQTIVSSSLESPVTRQLRPGMVKPCLSKDGAGSRASSDSPAPFAAAADAVAVKRRGIDDRMRVMTPERCRPRLPPGIGPSRQCGRRCPVELASVTREAVRTHVLR